MAKCKALTGLAMKGLAGITGVVCLCVHVYMDSWLNSRLWSVLHRMTTCYNWHAAVSTAVTVCRPAVWYVRTQHCCLVLSRGPIHNKS